ncbi:MAG TPA: metallophosphoesterase family protein [Spirochaetota bacterium]|nr:metallophosphoesterase family protein [Spirochaetota bacterium]
MKIACVSDIHGNAIALAAVLRDIDARGIANILCAGDFVGFGPFPEEVISLLRNRNIPCVTGNYDAKVLRFPDKKKKWKKKKRPESYESFRWTWKHLSKESREWLAALPFSHAETIGGFSLMMAHGSMLSYKDYIPAMTNEEELAAFLDGNAPDLFITGHTHVPFFTKIGDTFVVGCGSAGKPVEGSPDVSYVIVDLGEQISGEVVRVRYDVEKLCAAVIERGLPEVFADQFLHGKGH